MRLLWILSHFPAEGGLRSSTVVSDLSERVMNLTNAHNSLMTSGFCSLIFCCPADGMCRMRADKWTRQELTLDITGGGFDPGRSGSGKEQDSAGPGRRERVFWSPQDGSGLSGIVSDLIAGEGTDAAAQNGAVFMCHLGIHPVLLERVNCSQVQFWVQEQCPPSSALCSKVSLRGTLALCVSSLCTLSSAVSLILIDTKPSACRYQPNTSLCNENFPLL